METVNLEKAGQEIKVSFARSGPCPKTASRIEAFFTGHRKVIGLFHLFMSVFFISLIVIPPFFPLPAEDARIFDDITLFARFLFWGLWFPLVFLSTVLLGRAWCGILCPQGALSEAASRRGLNLRPPSWMRWEGTPALSFIIITVLGQLVGVRDYPLAALEIFGGTMALAVVTGFVFTKGKRSWCRFLCPIGALLGIFSRLGAVSFEPARKRMDGKMKKTVSCPTFIGLSNKTSSRHCIECFRCAQSDSKVRLSLGFRHPGKEIEGIAASAPSIHEVLFLFAATGLALGGFYWQISPLYLKYRQALGVFFTDLGLGGAIGSSGPWWLMANYPEAGEVFNWLDFISISSFMLASMAAATAVLFGLSAVTAALRGRAGAGNSGVRESGYVYAPVALVSLVVGLGGVLFQTMAGVVPQYAVTGIEAALFGAGGLWSAYLSYRVNGFGPQNLPDIAGILLVLLAWHSAIF